MGSPNPVSTRRQTLVASATTIAVISALLAFVPGTAAAADTVPPVVTDPATVSSDALAAPQINGVVWDQEIVGSTVYVAGDFTKARPAGSAAGVNEVARTYLLAYNLSTGALLSWAPTLNAQVRQLDASPDGSKIYAVGEFTTVNGVTKNRIAAFDTASGGLNAAFTATANNRVYTVAATNSTVYIGGAFSSVKGVARVGAAAISASNGTPTPWAPVLDGGRAYAMVVSPDLSKVVIAGDFTTLNGSGNPGYGLGAVDASSGASLPWAANGSVRNAGLNSAVYSLDSDADSVYGTGYVFGAGGNLEGAFRASWGGGEVKWVQDCHGDEYSIAATADSVYIAGHPHYCGNVGDFPQTDPSTFHRALAFSKETTGTLTAEPLGYANWAGTPAPTALNWYPDINLGSFTGQYQGPWSVDANADYVVYGGEFTTVNGKAQQGLVRFASKAIAPNTDGPRLTGDNLVPTLKSTAPGTMVVAWPADWDRDNEQLTYQVIRDGRTASPVYTTTRSARFWNRPTISWVDTGLAPGQTYSYRIRAIDPMGNSGWGTTVSATVATTGTLSNYAKGVIADQPTDYWRLGDAAGGTAVDSVGRYNASAGAGVSFGQAGAIEGDTDTAAAFSGASDGLAASSGYVWADNTFTVETWINTTTSSGGKIVGFGSANSGNSNSYDRHIYMNAAGNLLFGVYPGTSRTVQSAKKFNDGQWHHVVASLGAQGMQLYVDGKRVGYDSDTTSGQSYWGYWRIGGDNSWSGNPYIQGLVDDTAVYPGVLTQQQILAHYSLSGRTANVPVSPNDAYGAAVFDSDPLLYYRLGEVNGPVAADSGYQENPGSYAGDYSLGIQGAVKDTSDTAARFTNGSVASVQSFDNPRTYSTEIWFSTTTTRGGKLTGFGAAQSGLSGSYDRHVYMQDDGRLVFGTYTGQTNMITTPSAYNDGAWHHVVATQSSAGMRLYVDGALAGTDPQASAEGYTGYWRAGGDRTWGSSDSYFAGDLDEFAVYPSALNASTVAAHFELGKPVPRNVEPSASFTAATDDLRVSLNASASTDSDGTIAQYDWDFGDSSGVISGTEPTASHTYSVAGTYTVTLTVLDDDGASAAQTREVTVAHLNTVPTPIFTEVLTDLRADVDASGSSDPDGGIASYIWDFGDGTAGSGVTTSHEYAAAGTYTLTLTVTDNDGGVASVPHTISVSAPNVAPTAAFEFVASGLSVAFSPTDSTDPDGTVASYDWDFGDGTPHAAGATATHNYAVGGSYIATLVVTDNRGASGSASHGVTVVAPNGTPTAAFTATMTNLTVAVDASGSTDDGPIAGYAWAFGDGSTGTGATASHTFAAAGDYSVTLTVTDGAGQSDSETTVVTAIAAPTSTTVAEDRFTRTTASGWGAANTGGSWTVSSAANASVGSGSGALSHTAGATRKATLGAVSVTDVDLTTDLSFDKAMTGGGAYAGIVARQTASDYYQSRVRFLVGGGLAVQILQGGSTVLANATVPGNYSPGTSLTMRTRIAGVSPTTISSKVWPTGTAEPASWSVTATSSVAGLQSAGSVGLVGYASASITNAPLAARFDNFVATTGAGVVAPPPPANAAPTARFGSSTSGLVANVNATASSDADGTISSYAWTYGDGGTGAGVTASHAYASAGTYTVTLTVTDDDGSTGVTSAPVTVTAPPPPDPAAALAADDFARTSAAGWGAATSGGTWSTPANASYSVNGESGAFVTTAGATRRALLSGVSVADVELQVEVSSDKPVLVGQAVAGLVARQAGADFYQGRVRLLPSGAVAVQVVRGSATILGNATVAGLSYAPGDKLVLKVRVTGAAPTTISAKLWAVGTVEPSAWQVTGTDATAALQVAGPIGLESYVSASATNAPFTIRHDNFVARAAR
ncbi:MAG: hypothetical protein JWM50_1596 [Microbacteriaceae bacterium]|nr:hypothetical protein [Microbacteriaceae bacterium]